MVPPKPIPGESEQDFLRRKREYWRIKKKEQRARKAVREKGITQSFNSWKTRLPPLGLQTEVRVATSLFFLAYWHVMIIVFILHTTDIYIILNRLKV